MTGLTTVPNAVEPGRTFVWNASVLRESSSLNRMLSSFLFRRTQSTYFQVQEAARTFLVGIGLDPQMFLVYGEDDLFVVCWMTTDQFDAFCGEMVRQDREFKAYRYDQLHYVSAPSTLDDVGSISSDPDHRRATDQQLEMAGRLAREGESDFDADDRQYLGFIESQLLIPFDEARRGILLFILIEPLTPNHVPGNDLIRSLREHHLTGTDPRFSEIVLHIGQVASGPHSMYGALQPERFLIRCVSSEYERMHEIVQSAIGNVVEPCGYWTRTLIVAKSLAGPRLRAVRMRPPTTAT